MNHSPLEVLRLVYNSGKMNKIQFINLAICTILAVSVCFMPPTAMAAENELHKAAIAGDVAKLNRLIKAGADVNATSKDGWTPLHWAARKGHTDAVIALLEAGADVNATDERDLTPLYWAAFKGHTDAVIALLEAGADVRATDNRGRTPLDLAKINKKWSVAAILENHPE